MSEPWTILGDLLVAKPLLALRRLIAMPIRYALDSERGGRSRKSIDDITKANALKVAYAISAYNHLDEFVMHHPNFVNDPHLLTAMVHTGSVITSSTEEEIELGDKMLETE